MDTVPGDEEPPERDDEFTSAKKRLFLVALRKGQTVAVACEQVGVSRRTAYNHRESDADFAHFWQLARSMATLPLDLVAWERAVVGIEEPVYAYGKFSHMRVRRSDMLLRKVLEAEQPKKYARARIASHRRLVQAERKRIRQEIHAEIQAKQMTFEEAMMRIDRALKNMDVEGLMARYGDEKEEPEPPAGNEADDEADDPQGSGPAENL
jgi:hypothetical protein